MIHKSKIIFLSLFVGVATIFTIINLKVSNADISSVAQLEKKFPHLRTIMMEKAIVAPVSIEVVDSKQKSQQLADEIDEILQNPSLNGVITGISVRNANNGDLIYSHDGNVLLRPASNMKLLTAAAAMETLGPKYQFTTEVWTDGQIKDGVLDGDLYLTGKGDPTLLKKDLDALSRGIREKGIQQINGDLIGDDHWYDDVRYSQDLIWSDESYYYGGQISALTLSPNEDFDAGSVFIDVIPAEKVGDAPVIKVTPETEYVEIINNAETVADQEIADLSVERKHGTNQILIKGKVPIGTAKTRVWIAVWEPTGYALDIFKKSLEEHEVTFAPSSKLKTGETPEKAKLLVAKKSIPLEDLLIPFMKLSNNIHAETLVKEMGKVIHDEGSWEKGLEVMTERLEEFGLDLSSVLVRDGSGISDKDLITPNQLTKLLFEVRKKSWYSAFEQSQPISGEPGKMVGGTLRYRMTDEATKGKIKAKTGSITGVSTLSGYVTTASGEELVFSIMMNNFIRGSMTAIQDEICAILVNYSLD